MKRLSSDRESSVLSIRYVFNYIFAAVLVLLPMEKVYSVRILLSIGDTYFHTYD